MIVGAVDVLVVVELTVQEAFELVGEVLFDGVTQLRDPSWE